MNKIALIIEREYMSRVRKKSFIIMTLIGPLLFAGITVIPAWLAHRDSAKTTVFVLDKSGLFGNKLESNKETVYVVVNGDETKEKSNLKVAGEHHMLLVIGPTDGKTEPEVQFYGESNPPMDLVRSVENQIDGELKSIQLKQAGIDPGLVEKIKPNINIQSKVLNDEGEKDGSSAAATVVGYVSGFMIYIFIFLYGSQVMMGVMEEKTSRVVEVIISSVKPFQLMMGKIVGVALVGLTQFLLWMVLSYAISTVAASFFVDKPDKQNVTSQIAMDKDTEMMKNKVEKTGFLKELSTINIPYVAICFLFYFLGGYLLYSALFAAVGSAVETQQDAQQFMFPITIPIIGAIAFSTFVIKEPNSSLAFWLSVIPLTSPIIMMIRVPFEPPMWQILLSMVSLVLGFLGTTWLAGRIYRVGILMYGKKVTYKELWKWMWY